MNLDPTDFKELKEVIENLSQLYDGKEKTISVLLMSQFNIIRHLAESLKNDPEKFNEIMKDPVVGLTSSYAFLFMELSEKVLKKYGLRE